MSHICTELGFSFVLIGMTSGHGIEGYLYENEH